MMEALYADEEQKVREEVAQLEGREESERVAREESECVAREESEREIIQGWLVHYCGRLPKNSDKEAQIGWVKDKRREKEQLTHDDEKKEVRSRIQQWQR